MHTYLAGCMVSRIMHSVYASEKFLIFDTVYSQSTYHSSCVRLIILKISIFFEEMTILHSTFWWVLRHIYSNIKTGFEFSSRGNSQLNDVT